MKCEADFWSAFVRLHLHTPPTSVAWKIPAELRRGLPDVWTSSSTRSGWLELKYVPVWPVRESTTILVAATPDQLAHLRASVETGSLGGILLGVQEQWFLLSETVVRKQPERRFHRVELEQLSVARGMIRGTQPGVLRAALALL